MSDRIGAFWSHSWHGECWKKILSRNVLRLRLLPRKSYDSMKSVRIIVSNHFFLVASESSFHDLDILEASQ